MVTRLVREFQYSSQRLYSLVPDLFSDDQNAGGNDLALLARQLADRLVVLDSGRTIESGEVDQVIGAGVAEFQRRRLQGETSKSDKCSGSRTRAYPLDHWDTTNEARPIGHGYANALNWPELQAS